MVGAESMDLSAWAESYHLSFPVMWDNYSLYGTWNSPGTPIQHLVGPGSQIIEINSRFSNTYLDDVLDY